MKFLVQHFAFISLVIGSAALRSVAEFDLARNSATEPAGPARLRQQSASISTPATNRVFSSEANKIEPNWLSAIVPSKALKPAVDNPVLFTVMVLIEMSILPIESYLSDPAGMQEVLRATVVLRMNNDILPTDVHSISLDPGRFRRLETDQSAHSAAAAEALPDTLLDNRNRPDAPILRKHAMDTYFTNLQFGVDCRRDIDPILFISPLTDSVELLSGFYFNDAWASFASSYPAFDSATAYSITTYVYGAEDNNNDNGNNDDNGGSGIIYVHSKNKHFTMDSLYTKRAIIMFVCVGVAIFLLCAVTGKYWCGCFEIDDEDEKMTAFFRRGGALDGIEMADIEESVSLRETAAPDGAVGSELDADGHFSAKAMSDATGAPLPHVSSRSLKGEQIITASYQAVPADFEIDDHLAPPLPISALHLDLDPEHPASRHPAQYESPVAKFAPKRNKWGFPMTSKILPASTTLSLAPGEYVVAEYRWDAYRLSFQEWLICIATLGYYYCLTRKLNRRNHFYSILVTNLRVISKEEFYHKRGCGVTYLQKVVENQTSFKLSELSYLMSEHKGASFLGFSPSVATLELNFGEYPVSPQSSGVRSVQELLDQLSRAKDSVNEIIGYVTDLTSLAKKYLKWLWKLTKDAFCSPIQTFGESNRGPGGNAQVIKIAVELVQDPAALEELRKIVKAVIDHIPDRNVTRPVAAEECIKSMLVHSDVTVGVNSGKSAEYGDNKRDSFVVNTPLLYLHPDERVYDVCPDNYHYTCLHLLSVWATFGLYYLVLRDLIVYTTSYMITSKRVVKHSLRMSKVDGKILHHRLDMWFPDRPAGNYLVVKQGDWPWCAEGISELSVESDKKGTFNVTLYSNEFALKLATFLTAALDRREGHITALPHAHVDAVLQEDQAMLTRLALTADESVDASQHAHLPVSYCCAYMTCGLRIVPKTTLTASDRGIYVETYSQNRCFVGQRTLVFYPWNQVLGVYWENAFSKSSWCCDWPCTYRLCNLCYWSQPNPHRTCNLRVNVEGQTTFEFGVELYDDMYGVAPRPDADDNADNSSVLEEGTRSAAASSKASRKGGQSKKSTRRGTQINALVDSVSYGVASVDDYAAERAALMT